MFSYKPNLAACKNAKPPIGDRKYSKSQQLYKNKIIIVEFASIQGLKSFRASRLKAQKKKTCLIYRKMRKKCELLCLDQLPYLRYL